ncbi:unnamed protein product [Rhizophagus irregularis]|nr:unnamed protein product [Rhizophagus irregularis]
MSLPTKVNHETKISETARSGNLTLLMHTDSGGSISQRLAQLCDKALIAEECTLKANQEEILCWYHYGRNFIFQEKALNDKNKIGEKKARSLIYDEVVKQLNISTNCLKGYRSLHCKINESDAQAILAEVGVRTVSLSIFWE